MKSILFFLFVSVLTLAQPAGPLSFGSFNIQIFGEAKSSRPAVLDVLVDIVQRYDIIFIQELRDQPEETCGPRTSPAICRLFTPVQDQFELLVGDRVPPGGVEEQYAVMYNPNLFFITNNPPPFTFVETDPAMFIREPYIIHFGIVGTDFDFFVVNIHTQPDNADVEIMNLIPLIESLIPMDEDILVLGDFNADGSFFNEEEDWPVFFSSLPPGWTNLIDDSLDTTVAVGQVNNNTYDRILASPSMTQRFVSNSQSVFRFDTEPGLLDQIFIEGCQLGYIPNCPNPTLLDATNEVSDHYPVSAQFDFSVSQPSSGAGFLALNLFFTLVCSSVLLAI